MSSADPLAGTGRAASIHTLQMRLAELRPLPLAYGELGEADVRDLLALKDQIRRQVGFQCDAYKEKCLRRRLAVRMRARGVHRYGDYAVVLEAEPAEYEKLLAALTINVSKFLRNADVWRTLRARVIPQLFALGVPEVRIWSAGSAAGEEPYSVAMLLREHAEATGQVGALERFRILASDVDRESLDAARAAEYGELALAETPPETRARWFTHMRGVYRLHPDIVRMVTFEYTDLITASPPQNQHLVLCRNVIIYFERSLQEILFQRFANALCPGGFLVLGKVETLFGAAARSFKPIANGERIFTRA